jgi:hypothetical protein
MEIFVLVGAGGVRFYEQLFPKKDLYLEISDDS